jgi:hypothetical protein
MIALAFGLYPESQNIGDVLISESIIPYNPKRIGDKITINRGIEAPSSKILLNRFKNIKPTWEHIIDQNNKANLTPTRILSGEELIDNLEYRNKLKETYPESKGGEMEGAGLYAACDRIAEWIIVKGICDFADGNKGENKKERQSIAINSALSACMEIFNSYSVFQELKVVPYVVEKSEIRNLGNGNSEALFDLYDETKEPYYIIRDEDIKLISILNQYSIWIYGPTGCGKSNIILRNLIYNNIKFIQISLASCVGSSVDILFKEILYELSAQIGIKNQIQPQDFQECSKAIIGVLSTNYRGKEVIISIEEIPLSSESHFMDFSQKIFSLLISKNLSGSLDRVKFVLSSLSDPTKSIQLFQHKIHQQLMFLPMNYWNPNDINRLIQMIEVNLNFNLPVDLSKDLRELANGSPRFIKKFFRSILTINQLTEDSIRFILTETSRELHF